VAAAFRSTSDKNGLAGFGNVPTKNFGFVHQHRRSLSIGTARFRFAIDLQ
jgi:hypothetical protein